MNELYKKTFLMTFCVGIIGMYILAVADPDVEVSAKDGTANNHSTCTNTLNSLKAAKFQQRMLEQQALLSTAAGRSAEAATTVARVAEFGTVITVLEKLIADPKLNCGVYLENTDDK